MNLTRLRCPIQSALAMLAAAHLGGCDPEQTAAPSPETNWAGLLSDEELASDPDPHAPAEGA